VWLSASMKHARAYDTFKTKYGLHGVDMRRLGVRRRMHRPRCWSLAPIMRV
jgi:hypothetical protein